MAAADFWAWVSARLMKRRPQLESIDSIEAIEKDVAHALDWLEVKYNRLRVVLRPWKSTITFGIGLIACFHGRHFTFSILFLQAFRVTGWPIVKRASGELAMTYRRTRVVLKKELPTVLEAKQTLQRLQPQLLKAKASYEAARNSGDAESAQRALEQMQKLQAELQVAMQATSSLAAISRSVDPEKLVEIGRGLWHGVVACMATAMSGGVGRVGVGIDLGKMLMDLTLNVLKPATHALLRMTATRSDSVKFFLADPESEKWVDFFVTAACNAAGVAVAFWLDSLVFTVSNAMLGSEICVQELSMFAASRGLHITGTSVATGLRWALCSAGLFHQLIRGNSALPLPLAVVLSGPLLGERWLRRLAAVVRSRGGPGPLQLKP